MLHFRQVAITLIPLPNEGEGEREQVLLRSVPILLGLPGVKV